MEVRLAETADLIRHSWSDEIMDGARSALHGMFVIRVRLKAAQQVHRQIKSAVEGNSHARAIRLQQPEC